MRIVSLLPSATEIAVALGFGDALVGRSHECDWPPQVAKLPALTASKLRKGMGSLEIEHEVQAIVRSGLSVYEVDTDLLKRLQPDVILTQTQCAVCAVTPDDLAEALASWQGSAPTLVSLAPDNLNDVRGDFRRVAEALDASADEAVADFDARLDAVRRAVAGRRRLRVAAIEWIDPVMAAGNWVPELIEIAGGESLLAAHGQHSPWLEPQALAEANPEAIVLMPCGFTIPRALEEAALLANLPGWHDIAAVREGRIYATDGQYYFNRPGPRLVDSAEILADLLHPDACDFGHAGTGWVRLAPFVAGELARAA